MTNKGSPAPASPGPARDRLDAVLDFLPDVVIRYDSDGVVLHVNRAFEEATGLERASLVGRKDPLAEALPEITHAFSEARSTVFATGQPLSFAIVRHTAAGPRHVEYRMIPEHHADGSFDSVVAVGRDVTEREVARAALELERARLLQAQDIAKLGYWSWDVVNDTSDASNEVSLIFGMEGPIEHPVRTFFALIAPEDQASAMARVQEIDEQRLPSTEMTWRLIRPDGTSRYVHARSVWTYDASGRRTWGSGTLQDVTAEVEASLAMARQHAMLEESQRIAGVGSWELDYETGKVTWSAEMYRIAGLDPATVQLTRENVWDIVHPDDAPVSLERIRKSIETGEPTDYEWRLLRPDGSVRDIQARTRPTRDKEGRVVRLFGTVQDVTDRRRLMEQVRQGQKLEALGLLAGSIAHDFNNLLTAIIGGAELARLDLADDTDAARDLDEVRQAAARAARITRQLLNFGRSHDSTPGVVDLREVVYTTEKLLRRMLPDGIAFEIIASPTPVCVRTDPARIEQVLLNLVLNARDAIIGNDEREVSGSILVEVARTTISPSDPRLDRDDVPLLAVGEFAVISVRDDGMGMDESTRRRLFEPFFTTKPLGKGTGIGLPTVLGIARENGGYIDVDSALGRGSRFSLLLPQVDALADGVAHARIPLPVGNETVLLVEDETMVREMAARILERHGYNVLTARHGNDALLQWDAHADEIQLLLTDLRMPEMGGQDLVATLRARRSDLPVLVMSGYASGRKAGEKEMLSREHFVAKPFTTESLLVQVRAALSGPRQAIVLG